MEKDRDEMKKIILDLFGEKEYRPMRYKELCYFLQITNEDDKQLLLDILNELMDEYKIIKTKNNRFMLTPSGTHVGVFTGNRRGFGFVTVEGYDDDFFIHAKDTANAFEGD